MAEASKNVPLQTATVRLATAQAESGGGSSSGGKSIQEIREENLQEFRSKYGKNTTRFSIGAKRYYLDRSTNYVYDAVGEKLNIGPRLGKLVKEPKPHIEEI